MNLNQINNYFSFNIWFFNLITLTGGIFSLIEHYKNDEILEDCNSIFTLICFGIGGNILPILSCSISEEINTFIFVYSGVFFGFNIYNLNQISQECISYYNHNFNILWIYYYISIIIHGFNVLFYLIKLYLYIKIYREGNILNDVEDNEAPNLQVDNNIYEN